MRRAAAALALAAVTVTGCGAERVGPAVTPAPSTAPVERGALASLVSLSGTLSFRARPDGSPWVAINQARGVYTALPAEGDTVGCGDVLYRVDDDPVLLLCGTVPAFRALRTSDRGRDARQLRRNLRTLGYRTLEALQRARGLHATGQLALGDAVVLPGPARIAKVTGELGAPARPGGAVLRATSSTLEVRVRLDPAQRGDVRPGDRARIAVPGGTAVEGTVARLGTVARTDARGDQTASATIPASVRLDDPRTVRGLEQAPVQVDITTKGVEDVLSVPVTALVGEAGGGFAVEVVRAGGQHELVAVRLGLFDTSAGRVAVTGALREGDRVVVPSP